MIRYVIAVVLLVAILAISLPAIDGVASDRSEAQLRTVATTIEESALELVRTEEPPPRGVRGPQRVIRVNFPAGGFASKRVASMKLVPRPDENLTVLSYRIKGGPQRTVVVDAVVVNEGGNAVKLGSPRGRQTYRLRLARSDDGEPIVVFSRGPAQDPDEAWSP